MASEKGAIRGGEVEDNPKGEEQTWVMDMSR